MLSSFKIITSFYLFSSGTAYGGTQLQDFMSIGDKTNTYATDLSLANVAHVFVTVVARNKAGLTGIAYSKSTAVDFTPPEILFVREMSEGLLSEGTKNVNTIYCLKHSHKKHTHYNTTTSNNFLCEKYM